MIDIRKAKDIDGGMSGLKLMVVGRSGAGKTTMGAKAKDALIILTERQGLAMVQAWNPEGLVILVETADDVRGVLRKLRGSKVEDHTDGKPALMVDGHPIRTVVLDSMTDLQILIKNELHGMPSEGVGGKAQRSKGSSVKESLDVGEWGLVIDRSMRMLRSFRNLPVNLLVLFLATEVDNGEAGLVVRPTLYGKRLPSEVQQFFAGSGYIHRSESVDDEGQSVVTRAVMWDGGSKYPVKPFPGAAMHTAPDFDACLEAWRDYKPGAVTQPTVEEHVRGEASAAEKKAADKKAKAAAKRKTAAAKKKADKDAKEAGKDDEAGHMPEDDVSPSAPEGADEDDGDDDFFS